jgi:lipoprotein-releasing system permease protein
MRALSRTFLLRFPVLFLALRYLRLGRRDSFVSVVAGFSFVGLMLGTATLIVVMAVMNGFREQLITRVLGVNGHVGLYYVHGAEDGKTAEAWPQLEKDLQTVPGVSHAFPMIEQQTLCMARGRTYGGLVRGISAATFAQRPFLEGALQEGVVEDFTGRTIFLGDELAKQMGVFVGDTLTLAASQPLATAFGTFPRFRAFRVGGLFHFGMRSYDQMMIFMPMDEAASFFGFERAISGFEVFAEDPQRVASLMPVLQRVARPHGVRALDWRQANATFFSVIEVERNVMFVILTLMVVVAAFNIISCLVMLVKDKSRDIAILRAMGASRVFVARLFLWVGLAVGLLGTGLGVVLGLTVAWNVEPIRRFFESLTGAPLFPAEFYFLSQLPSTVWAGDVLAIVGVSVVLSLLAALYPARRAARLCLHQALRFE